MISRLKINNIALIDESLINFENGFNVLTGETGAGKSIIIDSLNFVLGSRADKTLIKSGTDNAKVEAVFEISEINENIKRFFDSIYLTPENTIIVTRYFSLNGKNECRVNGEIVTLNMLKNLTCELVDIFGQNDHYILMDTKNHLKLLDKLENKITEKLLELNLSLQELKKVNNSINEIGGSGELKESNIQLLKFEIDEIELANLTETEEEELKNKRTMFLNSEKLANNLNDAKNNFGNEDFNITSAIKNASFSLSQISNISSDIENLNVRLKSALYEINDISETINDLLSSVDYSEEELNNIEERLDLIKDLKRKYGKTIEDVNSYLAKSKDKLEKLLNSDIELKKLTNEKDKILKTILNICSELTILRKQTATKLSEKLVNVLKELGIAQATFKVDFKNDYCLENIEKKVSEYGADNIEFLFSANPGIEPRPLTKIISGGEMSRFMLAFKCVVKDDSTIRTMVFDEIDTGIGGLVGVEVAKKIAKISKNNQVLCVTHLAQIASFSSVHFKIEKSVNNNFTTSSITKLSGEQKIDEITRMLGSNGASKYGKLNAIELIDEANNFKNSI